MNAPQMNAPATVLVVEPDDDNRDALALLLVELGYCISTADSVDQGVEVSTTIHLDVVLIAALRELKEMRAVVVRLREARALTWLLRWTRISATSPCSS